MISENGKQKAWPEASHIFSLNAHYICPDPRILFPPHSCTHQIWEVLGNLLKVQGSLWWRYSLYPVPPTGLPHHPSMLPLRLLWRKARKTTSILHFILCWVREARGGEKETALCSEGQPQAKCKGEAMDSCSFQRWLRLCLRLPGILLVFKTMFCSQAKG